MSTMENLKEAFAGESQAFRKYMSYAKKAEQEGMPNIAKLFRTAAEAERIHAEGHLKAMGAVKSTVENLQDAINGETYEYSEMYPPMLQTAEADKHKAKLMFGYALKAEAGHAEAYQAALEAAKRGEDLAEGNFYLCPVCGHIEFGSPPDECPVCGAKGKVFVQV